jgi:hypothetical protein
MAVVEARVTEVNSPHVMEIHEFKRRLNVADGFVLDLQ